MFLSQFSQFQQRLFAWGMSFANRFEQQRSVQCVDCASHSNMAACKTALLGELKGTVLEIGPGAGANFSYYPSEIHWIGIEPNPYMYHQLYQEAERHGIKYIKLLQGQAEALPIESASIDAVVSTHVLCSVTDLDAVLKEILRVLKPGGTFRFFEHVGAPLDTWTRRLQNILAPIWRTLFDGCHPNRDIQDALAKAGFSRLQSETFQLKIPMVSPHVFGVATKFLQILGPTGFDEHKIASGT